MKMSEMWLENIIFQKTHIAKADMITKNLLFIGGSKVLIFTDITVRVWVRESIHRVHLNATRHYHEATKSVDTGLKIRRHTSFFWSKCVRLFYVRVSVSVPFCVCLTQNACELACLLMPCSKCPWQIYKIANILSDLFEIIMFSFISNSPVPGKGSIPEFKSKL